MKTIESKRLFLKNERSDKVYEAELSQVGDDKFVVNFRYGRRGSRMIEGTKTVFPVVYDEAKVIFDKLVDSKVSKGYSESGEEPVQEVPVIEVPQVETDRNTDRDKAIIRNLKDVRSGTYTGDWKTSRMLWRAGVLEVADAVDHIVPFLISEEPMEVYSAMWALSKIGTDKGYQYVHDIYKMNKDPKVTRLATNYLLRVEGIAKTEVKSAIESRLPSFIREGLYDSKHEATIKKILEFIGSGNEDTSALLLDLYYLSLHNDTLRTAVYSVVEEIPMKLNFFRGVRYIYKLAELNEDHPIYAVCAKKIAVGRPLKVKSGYERIEDRYVKVMKGIKNADDNDNAWYFTPSSTNAYLGRRGVRHLSHIEAEKPSSFIPLATELMLSLNDEKDNEIMTSKTNYLRIDGRWSLQTFWIPKYSKFPALLSLLYTNSQRLSTDTAGRIAGFMDGAHEADELTLPREEKRPELWNSAPEHIVRLIRKSRSAMTSNFALKVFHDNPDFKRSLKDEHLTDLLGSFHAPTLRLGINLLKDRFKDKAPGFDIILSLLSSEHEEASTLGRTLLMENCAQHLSDTAHIAQLILLGKESVLDILSESGHGFSKNAAIQFSQIADLLYNSDAYSTAFYTHFNQFVNDERSGCLFNSLSKLDLDKFIEQERIPLLELGLALVRVNKLPSHELASSYIEKFLNMDNENLRAAGIRLLGEFPEEYLIEKAEMIIGFMFAHHADTRKSVEPSVLRLIEADDEHKEALFHKLINSITKAEEADGMHDDNMAFLNTHYAEELNGIDEGTVIKLLLSDVDASQKIGEQMFYSKGINKKLDLKGWLPLKDCDTIKVRDELISYFLENKSDIISQLELSLKVLDADWEDVRGRSFDFYMEQTTSEHWSLELVLMIIDNPKEDVQAFGRALISRLFHEERGKDLMLHMSEHPSRSMMLFTSNYLDIHAKDSEYTVLLLKQYFKNILFGVNVGAASKARVFAFLKQEAMKNRKVSEMTVELLSDILATESLKDKSQCLDILLEIYDQHSDIEMPLKIKPIKTYTHAV